MYNRKQFDNPTPPVRCNASASSNPGDGAEVSVKCNKRVFKSGLCGHHYAEAQTAREARRLAVTRHRIGVDELGKMQYGTRGEPKDEQHWCSHIPCRRPPIINLENKLYCERHFMLVQVAAQRKQDKIDRTRAA